MTIREKLNPADIKHRKAFAEYATHDAASDWHREILERLHAFWDSINGDHFEGACIIPHILLAEPKTPRALGDHATVSGWGSRNQIRLRPNLITGKHKLLKPGDEYHEGRMLFVEDVLLHEAVHQYCDEVLHSPENGHKGHGPVFTGECNRIGAALGLSPVGIAKKGRRGDLPSCADWPQCVRPPDYYLGALAEPEPEAAKEEDDEDEGLTFPCPYPRDEAFAVLNAHLPLEDRQWFARQWLPDGKPIAEKQARPQAAPVSVNGDAATPAPKRRGRPPKEKAAPAKIESKPIAEAFAEAMVKLTKEMNSAGGWFATGHMVHLVPPLSYREIEKRLMHIWQSGTLDREPIDGDARRGYRWRIKGAPEQKPKSVSPNRDKPAGLFHKGDRVRYSGTGKPKLNGTIHSVQESSAVLDGILYVVKWDDRTEGLLPAARLEHVRRGRPRKDKPAMFSVIGDKPARGRFPGR
jgi:hypothetical protein